MIYVDDYRDVRQVWYECLYRLSFFLFVFRCISCCHGFRTLYAVETEYGTESLPDSPASTPEIDTSSIGVVGILGISLFYH